MQAIFKYNMELFWEFFITTGIFLIDVKVLMLLSTEFHFVVCDVSLQGLFKRSDGC